VRQENANICDFCRDSIRVDGRVMIRENGKVRFIFDEGCAILLEAREMLKVKRNYYKIKRQTHD
jgi:hypothetical protein